MSVCVNSVLLGLDASNEISLKKVMLRVRLKKKCMKTRMMKGDDSEDAPKARGIMHLSHSTAAP